MSLSFKSLYSQEPVRSQPPCAFNFDTDLQSGKIKLFLIGGIAPIMVQGQNEHEKIFNFEYYDYGCTPENEDCIKEYSKKAFKYLDSKYGKRWRKQVRKDVLYLKNNKQL